MQVFSGELNSALQHATGSKSDLELPIHTLTPWSFASTSQVMDRCVLPGLVFEVMVIKPRASF